MAASKKTIEAEQVLVRHVVEGKRNDIGHIAPLLRAPFPSDSSSREDGGARNVEILGYPIGSCLVAARFAKQPWVALYSNAASAGELFKANASSTRLEVAWLGCRPEAGWFFKLSRAGKVDVDFVQAPNADSPSTCELVGLEPNLLKPGDSGEEAVDRLCRHFEIQRPMPVVRFLDDGFKVIDAAGRPTKSGLRGYARLDGPQRSDGDAEAAVALKEAIDGCDADGIRKAVEQGASLTSPLPGGSVTPLLAALFKFGRSGWNECVELLLKLGCPINGVKKDPPIVACAGFDELAEKTMELLVAHGADVNSVDREGTTALFECVIRKRIKLTRFLMQHGADPTIKNRNGTSALDWLRKRYEEETGFSSRTTYAKLLSVLTGQAVATPEAPTLRPELQAENKRFKLCLKARRLIAVMPTEFELKPENVSPFAKMSWFRDWQKELLSAGFLTAGHYALLMVRQSAYTHPKLGFDAILSGSADQPRCEIVAYHDDHSVTLVTNLRIGNDPDFAQPATSQEEFTGASPAQLIAHLKLILRGKSVLALDVASFAARYKQALSRQAIGTRERAEQVLKTASILIDGSPPCYERLGFYMDFSIWDDPSYSTEKHAQRWLDDLGNANQEPPESLGKAIDAAVELVAMKHFQFAGAPDVRVRIVEASKLALAYSQACARDSKADDSFAWLKIRRLLHGLLLCALAKRWETFDELCNSVPPKLASADTTDVDVDDYAQVLLLFVSNHRERPFPKAAALEQAAQKRRASRPRLLLDVCRAIAAGQEADLEEALRRSLEYFLKLRPEERIIRTSGSNNPFRYVAFPESMFRLAALNRGLKLSPLPQHLADLLITPKSIGASRK
jgi:Ankyrin repeats (3 copies)